MIVRFGLSSIQIGAWPEPAHGPGDVRPVVALELAVAQPVRVDLGLRAEEALGELEVAHLEREEEARLRVGRIERGVGEHPERERRLAHRRAGADDHERAGLQSREQQVEVEVAGGGAGDGRARFVQRLDVVEVLRQERRQLAASSR